MSKQTVTEGFGACPHDCPDGCGMLYSIDNGKLVNVRGNPDHPYTRGRLCVKVKDYHQHHYNSERTLYPLRRTGKKGSRKFKRISWDDALDEISHRWNSITDQYGAEAILPYGYFGNIGLLNGSNAGDAFFNKLGSSISEKTLCTSSLVTAQLMTIGPTMGTDPESFAHSKYIILWGANTLTTNSHLWPFVLTARKNGAKLVVIDPYRTRTAAQADWHIAVNPGTDAVLALSMIHILIEESLVDRDYVENYTLGYEELKASAATFTAEVAAPITGVETEDIKRLAREFASTPPAVIRMGVGPERYPDGGQAIRAIDCIPALVGAWRHAGGGLMQMPCFVPVCAERLSRPDWSRKGTRVINLGQIGEVLNSRQQLSPPVMSLFIWNANPVASAPDANLVVKGLARDDLFTVVSEQFITDTAAYADIILPATMAGEHEDILTSWGHFYINFNQKVIDPPGEAVSNSELFRRLAGAMGFDDPHFSQSDDEMLAAALDWGSPLLQGITFDTLKEKGFVRITVPEAADYAPHKEGNFPTPSGKCEFTSSLGEQAGFVSPYLRQLCDEPQIGHPIAPVPNCNLDDYGKILTGPENSYPLHLISPKSHGFLNSEYANESHKLRSQGAQFVLINESDANSRCIKQDDEVSISNDLGMFQAEAKISKDVRPGIIVSTFGYWRSLNPGGGAVNALTPIRDKLFAGTPQYYDVKVEVKKTGTPDYPR